MGDMSHDFRWVAAYREPRKMASERETGEAPSERVRVDQPACRLKSSARLVVYG